MITRFRLHITGTNPTSVEDARAALRQDPEIARLALNPLGRQRYGMDWPRFVASCFENMAQLKACELYLQAYRAD